MKNILQFLRTTLAGGILFLVPIVVLVIVLGKALALTHKFVDPLAKRIPVESVIGLQTPMLLGVGVIVLFCFLAGFFARMALAQKIVSGLEAAVLSNVPGYEFLKGVGQSVLGIQPAEAYPVVLARFDDAWQIGFQVEALENGLVAVFVPDAPNAHSGAVYFMTPDRITPANIPLAATLKCLKRLGAGSNPLLRGVSLEITSTK